MPSPIDPKARDQLLEGKAVVTLCPRSPAGPEPPSPIPGTCAARLNALQLRLIPASQRKRIANA